MYGQGNYPPQLGKGNHTPVPPFELRPPFPPPPAFQQGPSAQQPSTIQQGTSFFPQRAGPPLQVPHRGTLNASHSYLPPPPPLLPPPPVHGSTSVIHSYSTAPQNPQWAHNVQHIAPPVPPSLGQPSTGPSRPELLFPLPPHRLPPPPPSQGQTLYRAPIQVLQSGGVQGTQYTRPPPPPTSSFFTNPYGSFSHTTHQDTRNPHMAPPPPPAPPLPSSPPPPPPSPPPPASPPQTGNLSSCPSLATSDLPSQFVSHPSSKERSRAGGMASDFVDKVVLPHEIRSDASPHGETTNTEGRSHCEEGSPAEDGLSSAINAKLDLPPPPCKPEEENIVKNIEVLCQFIAKNGPTFEDMARQKEFGNPEFEFLFGGEPGSKAYVAHEYFKWMKKKCSLAYNVPGEHEQGDSSSRPSAVDSSVRPGSLMDAGVSNSPSDSDMDMEDDITQPDEQSVYNSFEGPKHESILPPNGLDMKEHLNAEQNASAHNPSGVSKFEHLPCYGPTLAEQGKVDLPVTTVAGAVDYPVISNEESSSIPPQQDLGQSYTSTTGIMSEKLASQLPEGTSPFRLLQDYASDDSSENDDKPHLEDVSLLTGSPSGNGTDLHRDVVSNFQTDVGRKSLSTGFETFSEPAVACSPSMPSEALECSRESESISKEITGKIGELVENDYINKDSTNSVASHEAFPQKDSLGGVVADVASKSGKSKMGDVKYSSVVKKVDEFGRLIREDASDSDSADSRYKRKRVKRDRNHSRSRSPRDKGRRRSPWRRKERRSRSRSWSPKKQRSRSRSPTYRRGGEFGGDKMRRDKIQLRDCLDFLRGKCYRGASCRFLHNDSDKSDGSRRHRSKFQHEEVTRYSRSSDFQEEVENVPFKNSVPRDENKGQEMRSFQDPGIIFNASNVLVSARDDRPPIMSDGDTELFVPNVVRYENSVVKTTQVQETRDIDEQFVEPTNHLIPNVPKSAGDTSHTSPSMEHFAISQTQSSISDPVLQSADHQSLQILGSSSLSSPVLASATFQTQIPISESHPDKVSSISSFVGQSFPSEGLSSQPVPPKELIPPSLPGPSFPQNPLPLAPPVLSLSQETTTSLSQQLPSEYNLMPQTLAPHSTSVESRPRPAFQAPFSNEHSNFSAPLSSSWTSLPRGPPPPPYVNNSTINAATGSFSGPLSQFPQSQLPPRNYFYSQVESQHLDHPPMQEAHRPPLQNENFRSNASPMGNPLNQTFGAPGLVGEDRYTRLPFPDPIASNTFAQGQSFPADNRRAGELFNSSSQNHPYLQQQQPLYGLQRPAAHTASVALDEPGNINSSNPRCTSDLSDRSQPCSLPEFGRSRIAHHYNPYASTFDQPLGSKFSSNAYMQPKDTPYAKHDASFGLSHVSVDEQQGVGSYASRVGGGQYDPLFDSIEPYSNSSRDHVKKLESNDDSDTILRLSRSHKPLDVAVTTSVENENDEYGETADAEVGAVENESPSNSLELGDAATGEIEIDQVKTPGKSKKSKGARSMKLFKVSLADFVKEVLKPSWRQGNMSKEAFKTIVKKTVDKVSGAMKSHQIPKSQAKINQYIDSSQRKLTKLVMGYVDKYVKM